jgi:prepilin-type N-terminal cleavage/methylation domain-containing protein
MSNARRSPRAFTLIELLVVVSILALLVAVLLPSLAKARDVARRAVCMVNFKSLGLGMHAFSALKGGRFPSHALWDQTNGAPSGPYGAGMYNGSPSGWAPWWESIINWEYFQGNKVGYYPTPANSLADEPTIGPIIRFWTFWSPTDYKPEYLKKRYATCTNFKGWMGSGSSNQWCRPWIANMAITGGRDSDWGAFPVEGEYGKKSSSPKSTFWNYKSYYLGAKGEIFKNASYKFMVFESEYYDETRYIFPGGGTATGSAPIGDSASNPPWTSGGTFAVGGFFSFRHMLPTDRSLWQTQASATALFIDGHCSTVAPNDKIATGGRFGPEQ